MEIGEQDQTKIQINSFDTKNPKSKKGLVWGLVCIIVIAVVVLSYFYIKSNASLEELLSNAKLNFPAAKEQLSIPAKNVSFQENTFLPSSYFPATTEEQLSIPAKSKPSQGEIFLPNPLPENLMAEFLNYENKSSGLHYHYISTSAITSLLKKHKELAQTNNWQILYSAKGKGVAVLEAQYILGGTTYQARVIYELGKGDTTSVDVQYLILPK